MKQDVVHLRPAAEPRTSQQEQDTEIRLYLIALELVSDGKCASYGPKTAGGESEAIGPSGDSNPAFLRLGDSYRGARNWGERQDVIDQARVEVLALKRTAPIPVSQETREELAKRMLEEAVDLTPQLVAQTKEFGLFTARQVVAIRMRADPPRDPETGRERPDTKPDDWQIEAARLLAEGYSLNAINFKLRIRRSDLLAWAREREAA